MTRDDIIRMAKEAGIEFFNSTDPEFYGREYCEAWIEEQHAFAELIAAAEREACAQVCDKRSIEDSWEGCYADQCAADIRARGEK
jgi:hypothetical protein